MAARFGARLSGAVRDIARSFEMQFGMKRGRSLQVAGASCAAGSLAGLGKLVMGLLSQSAFVCISGLYSLAMVLAKAAALSALARGLGRQGQIRYAKVAGLMLATASLLYMAYTIRLIWHTELQSYPLWMSVGIAAFAFYELGLNIRGVLIERRSNQPLFYALKTINLASACIGIALTQRVLLALNATQDMELVHARANMLIGLIMGACALMLGIGLVVRMRRMSGGT